MTAFSVIVPCWGTEPYLHRCIDSILRQSYQDFELILVDDGSPDACGSICDKYALADDRVKVFHKKNAGVSMARNVGLDAAQGKYVLFVDSDDYLLPEALDTLWKTEQAHPADYLYFQHMEPDETGKASVQQEQNADCVLLSTEEERLRFLRNLIVVRQYSWAVWSGCFDRDVIEQNKLRFISECNNFGEDLAFTFTFICYSNRIQYLNVPLYYYDTTNESSAVNKSKGTVRIDDINEVLYYIKDAYREAFKRDDFDNIHYDIIKRHTGVLYRLETEISIYRQWDDALQKLRHKRFFAEKYRSGLQNAKKNTDPRRLMRWKAALVDQYLSTLDFSAFYWKLLLWKAVYYICSFFDIVIHFPNRAAMTILGVERYTRLKRKFGRPV